MGETNFIGAAPKFLTPTVGATISIDPTQSINWLWTPAQNETINALNGGLPGQGLTLVILTSGVSPFLLTLGTNFLAANVVNTGPVSGNLIVLRFISNGAGWIPMNSGAAGALGLSGTMITKMVTFTEDATHTSHVGTIPIPAGAWLHSIQVTSDVLWGAAAAVLKVGDTAVDNGYFTGVNIKATDLLVGEVLDTEASELWGGKNGAYLVAATGQRGPTSVNFSKYYAAGSNIIGTVTVTTPAVTTGRTRMLATYSIGEGIAAIAS